VKYREDPLDGLTEHRDDLSKATPCPGQLHLCPLTLNPKLVRPCGAPVSHDLLVAGLLGASRWTLDPGANPPMGRAEVRVRRTGSDNQGVVLDVAIREDHGAMG